MSKVAIISDLHLGGSHYHKVDSDTGLNRYMIRNMESAKWALNYLKANAITDIIIPGDTFDIPNPSVYVLDNTKKLFSGFNVDAIQGNHDYTSLQGKEEISAISLVGFNAYNKPTSKVVDNINFVFIPWGEEIDTNLVKPDKKNVLIVHGFIRKYGYEVKDEQIIDQKKASHFDLVLAGHLHENDAADYKGTKFVSVGATIPSLRDLKYNPGFLILDTEKCEFIKVNIPNTPKVIKKTGDDIDKMLKEVAKEDIYRFNVTSNSVPDSKLTMRAKQVALDIQINYDIKETVDTNNVVIKDFWSYLDDNYPDYKDEFKNRWSTLVEQ